MHEMATWLSDVGRGLLGLGALLSTGHRVVSWVRRRRAKADRRRRHAERARRRRDLDLLRRDLGAELRAYVRAEVEARQGRADCGRS